MTIIQTGFFGSLAAFCETCGRALSNPLSVQAHQGPICRAKGKITDMKTTDFDDITLHEPLENGIVIKRIDGKVATNVPHLVAHHSPSGFEFGYAGSGPADLALNLMEVVLNRLGYEGERTLCFDGDCWDLAYQLHQDAKFKFITPLLKEGDVIPYEMVEAWVKQRLDEEAVK